MQKTNDFFNKGFGWVCRHCDRELGRVAQPADQPSRFFSEGEAEAKMPQLSSLALAKWADPERRTLVCPRCGITERIDIA